MIADDYRALCSAALRHPRESFEEAAHRFTAWCASADAIRRRARGRTSRPVIIVPGASEEERLEFLDGCRFVRNGKRLSKG